jgi:hypothetical protein
MQCSNLLRKKVYRLQQEIFGLIPLTASVAISGNSCVGNITVSEQTPKTNFFIACEAHIILVKFSLFSIKVHIVLVLFFLRSYGNMPSWSLCSQHLTDRRPEQNKCRFMKAFLNGLIQKLFYFQNIRVTRSP